MTGLTPRRDDFAAYDLEAEALTGKARSLTGDALARFLRNKAAMVSVVMLTLLILAASGSGPISCLSIMKRSDWSAFRAPPSWESGHYLGTDQNGRDLMARVLYGTRVVARRGG
jgi:oligopeptide transport system permease protein